MSDVKRKRLGVAIRVVVSGGVIAGLLILLPVAEMKAGLAALPPTVWAVSVLVFLAGHLLGTFKWRMMVNAGRANLGRVAAVRCYAAGLFANLCLPSIVGGDVLRAALAGRLTRRPEAAVWGGVADRLIDVAALGILVGVAGLVVGPALPGWQGPAIVAVVLAGAVASGVGLGVITRRPLRRWRPALRRPVGRSLVALRRLRRSPSVAARALGLALTLQAAFVLINAWIGGAVGIDVPLAAWFVVWPLAKIAGLAPISLGGLGVRDATQGGLLLALGVPAALGVVASLIWQTILIAGGIVAGLVWWGLGRGGLPWRAFPTPDPAVESPARTA